MFFFNIQFSNYSINQSVVYRPIDCRPKSFDSVLSTIIINIVQNKQKNTFFILCLLL